MAEDLIVKGNGGEAFGELKATVVDHGRRLTIIEAHPVTCSAAKDVKDIVAWKNKWAGAMVVLQVASLVLGLVALVAKVRP